MNNANALPQIFQREARRVARPLIYENDAGIAPQSRLPARNAQRHRRSAAAAHRLRADEPSRRIRWSKSRSSRPSRPARRTTRSWPVGPTGWARPSPSPPTPAPAGPPTGPTGRTTTSSSARCPLVDAAGRRRRASSPSPPTSRDGQVAVVVTALDKNDEFLNFLDMSGTRRRAGPASRST